MQTAKKFIYSTFALVTVGFFLSGAPLAVASPPCGTTITTDTTLDSDMTCSGGDAITIGAANITLDGAGHTITGGSITNNGFNYVTVKNCNLVGSNLLYVGIFFANSNHGTITNNTVNGTGNGIYIQDDSNDNITFNVTNSNFLGPNNGYGIQGYGNYNTFDSNTANLNWDGLFLGGSNNIITNNTANSNQFTGIVFAFGTNNTISGNTTNSNLANGIELHGGADSNIVSTNTSNFNQSGFANSGANGNTLDSNTFSANNGNGMFFFGGNNNVITRNAINSTGRGLADGAGIQLYFSCNGNVVGGPGAGNTIAFNAGSGIEIIERGDPSALCRNNTVSQNSIFSNSALGIDLCADGEPGVGQNHPDGVTPDTPCNSGNAGANLLQNHPVLYSVSSSAGSTTIMGGLNGTANTTFTIEFFSNDAGNASGYGEGQTFIGSTQVTTGADCNVCFSAVFPVTLSTGQVVTMTATDPGGNTSEFSSWSPSSIPYSTQIQQPINSDGSSVFSARRGVVPVKFTLSQCGAPTCALPPATIALTRTAGGTIGTIDESVYSGPADTGSNFRSDSCQYIYNLSASTLGVGTYRVDAKINGQVVGSGIFGLN